MPLVFHLQETWLLLLQRTPLLDCGSPTCECFSFSYCYKLMRVSKGDSTVIKAHAAAVRSVDFSKTGRMLLTASDDKSIKVSGLPLPFNSSRCGH